MNVAVICIAFLGVGAVVHFAWQSPARDVEWWRHEISQTLPEEATAAEVLAWTSAHGLEATCAHGENGEILRVDVVQHREYFFYWNGQLEFVFCIGEDGRCRSHSVDWWSFAL
jgi:hypothetical protein